MEHIQEKEPPEVITSDTDNATKIHPSDAPSHKYQQFQRFRAYNTGMWYGPEEENKEKVRRQDNLHRYDSIASSVELTDYQKSRGRSLLDEIKVKDVGINVDSIIFAICVLVANDDVSEGSRYYPHPEAAGDEMFVSVGESLELDRADQISAIEKVRAILDTDDTKRIDLEDLMTVVKPHLVGEFFG
jgi:hypothetical protein